MVSGIVDERRHESGIYIIRFAEKRLLDNVINIFGKNKRYWNGLDFLDN